MRLTVIEVDIKNQFYYDTSIFVYFHDIHISYKYASVSEFHDNLYICLHFISVRALCRIYAPVLEKTEYKHKQFTKYYDKGNFIAETWARFLSLAVSCLE